MASFPFDRLPVELQLLVWQHARANIGRVVKGDMEVQGPTLSFSEGDMHRIKDYTRLLSICPHSRHEALANPLVFHGRLGPRAQNPTAKPFDAPLLGGLCTDIILEDPLILLLLASRQKSRGFAKKEHQYTDMICQLIRILFGPSIQRLHIKGDETPAWTPSAPSLRLTTDGVNEPAAPFRDVDGLDSTVPWLQCAGFGEVARRDVHGAILQNIAHAPLPALSNTQYADCLNIVVAAMAEEFPDSFEYVSVVSPRADAAEHAST